MKMMKFETYLLVAFLGIGGAYAQTEEADDSYEAAVAEWNSREMPLHSAIDEILTIENSITSFVPVVTSPDFDFYIEDPFACRADDKYGELADILGTGRCFDHKLNKKQNTGYQITEEMLLQKDEEICTCLKADKNPKIAKRMNLSDKEQFLAANQEVSKSINGNLKNLMGSIESLRDSMLFQADILFRDSRSSSSKKNDAAINELVNFYSGGAVTESFNNGPARQRFTGMATDLKSMSQTTLGRNMNIGDYFSTKGNDKKEANADLGQKIDKALQDSKISPPNIELISQPDFQPGQCVGPKEFIAKNQLPAENDFYLGLATEKFDEKNWNYDTLEARLIELTKDQKKNASSIASLEMRMKYLNRNPFIKNFFAADDDYEEYIDAFGYSDDTKKKFKATPSKYIKDKKSELFKIIQTQLSPKDKHCGQKPSGCKKDAIDNYREFKKLNDNFFKDEKVGLFTNAQAQRFMFDEIDKFKNDPLSVADEIVPYTQDAIEKFVLSKTKYDPALCNNRQSAGVGEGYSYDLVSCIDTYGLYCSAMAIAKKNAADGVLDVRYRAKKLAQETKSFFNPNYEENHELKKFNEEFCGETLRTANDGSGSKSFNDFKNNYCETRRTDPTCGKATFSNIAKLREIYRSSHTFPTGGSDTKVASVAAQQAFDDWNMGIQDTSIHDASVATGDVGEFPSSLENMLRDISETNFGVADDSQKFEEAGMFTNLANVVSENNIRPTSASFDSTFDDVTNYSNLSAALTNTTEEAKIDNLSTVQKEEILSQWRTELSAFKNENKESSTTYDVTSEAQMKAKIEALETLLSQQRKLTEDQYKLLNTAISNRQIAEAPKTATPAAAQNNDKETMEKVRARSNSGFATTALASGTLSEDTTRGPASIKDNQPGTSASSSGSASLQRSSSASGARASADSVAREEAKLVNLRRFPDGSITIESAGKGGQVAPNAITVPVSDEQYRLLQSNPSALSLSQIEKSIPKEQLAELEKSGQIILVLQNGENPPFEVKVEKKDNKLVYQLQDPQGNNVNPIQRVFTRQALELELKIQ